MLGKTVLYWMENRPSGVREELVLSLGKEQEDVLSKRVRFAKPKFFSNHTLLSEATQRGGAG